MTRTVRIFSMGMAFIFLLNLCGEPLAQQPPPRSSEGEGGDDLLVPILGGVLGAIALGFLVKWWLDRDQLEDFVSGQILAVLPLGTSEEMETIGRALALDHHLSLLAIHELRSVNYGMLVYASPDKKGVLKKLTQMETDPRILFAQPNFRYTTVAQSENRSVSPSYARQMIQADLLHPAATGKGILIGIIDTGLDRQHPAFKDRILESVDFTGEGFTPDLHGTLIAGIIAASPTHGPNVQGIAPDSGLVAIKACHPVKPHRAEARCASSSLAQALDFAILRGVQVINFSVGGPQEPLLKRLVDEAATQDRVVVAAAGNDGPKGPPRFPAAYDNALAVTAVDVLEGLYSQATQGNFIDLAAPGVEVVSTAPQNEIRISSGTSLAAAHVTGAVALLLQNRSSLPIHEIQRLLEESAKDLGPPGRDPLFGSGLVDACKAFHHSQKSDPCR